MPPKHAHRDVHVIPRPDGERGWSVIEAGSRTPLSNHRTQKSAIAAARPRARRNASHLVVFDRSGRTRASTSHGNDLDPESEHERMLDGPRSEGECPTPVSATRKASARRRASGSTSATRRRA